MNRVRVFGPAIVIALLMCALPVSAEEAKTQPSFKIGATIFADYTYQQEPKATDAAGSSYSPSSFSVGRAYVNVTGTLSDVFSFRITPDITRESGTGSSLNGSYDVRLKYAFLQANLDRWAGAGSWVRLGLQQTPYVDYVEGVYKYRFQGPIAVDREGFLTSSDNGLAARFGFPGDHGDVMFGIYNGEGYSKAEVSNTKAFQARVSVRPVPGSDAVKGLRFAVFFDKDNYLKNATKDRLAANVTYEHPRVNAGIEYLKTKDQMLPTDPKTDGKLWSVWATPKIYGGLGALLRHDELEPDTATDAKKKRDVIGLGYWFPTAGKTSTALSLDYEKVSYNDYVPTRADEKRYALHALVNF